MAQSTEQKCGSRMPWCKLTPIPAHIHFELKFANI